MNDTLQQFLTLNSKFRIHNAHDSLKILKQVQPAGLDFDVGPPVRGGLSP